MNEKKKLRSSTSVMQVIWLFLSVVLVAIIFSAGMYVSSQMVHTRYNSDMEAFYQIAGLKDMLYQCDESMASYLRSGNRANLVEYNDGVREFMIYTDRLMESSAEVTGSSLLYSIDDAFSSYQSSSNYAAHYFYGKQNVPAYDALYEARRISAYIKEYCDLLLETYIQIGYDHHNAIEKAQHNALVMEGTALLLLLIGAVIGIRTLQDNFARPLSGLYDASVQIAEGNFDVTVSEEHGDETMRSLSRTYNTMTMSIQRMVEDLNWAQKVKTELLNEQLKNTEYQRLLEQASFLALQSQVNPHFMFNTLNSISRTIMLGRSDDAVSMINALAVLLRYNLADAYAPATLAEELEVIRQYMTIQQCRFPDRIRAEYQYDPALAHAVHIPRFTLQPIVENAVIHGLEPKLGPGTLHIEARQDGDVCQIDIWDDGVGMSRETLEAVLTGTHRGRKGHTNSIGVNNTKKRMQVFTHMEDCFHMESEPGKGMLVRLRLPIPGKEKKEEKPDV
ncbi:MAG: sensor histidine kinase [Clostridia bacterium]|nr:sensor histidine kinase [Clostridia bacterium]